VDQLRNQLCTEDNIPNLIKSNSLRRIYVRNFAEI
jgi:hypothetical protein